MNILLIGSGGREHALAWKIAASPETEKLFCAPGNGGTARLAENVSLNTSDRTEGSRRAGTKGTSRIAGLPVSRFDRNGPALEFARNMGGDDFAHESIRRQVRFRLRMDSEKAAIAGSAQERPLKINRMSTESGPV